MDNIDVLIERLQAATTPDRDLDIAIAEVAFDIDKGTDEVKFYGVERVPQYTHSVDDALTLVPEEHDWVVASVNGQVGGTPYACVGSDESHYGETPVLSLCIAALRAHRAIR